MPKYTLSPQKQMAILKMQNEYLMDLKMTKRLRQNQMLARGTVNLFRRIRNVYTRKVLMRQPDKVTIHRGYLEPLHR